MSIDDLKSAILNDPAAVLDDTDVMRALLHAHDNSNGDKVVDLRGVFVERLETRLNKLEDTHRNVIAAAYDNLSGTNQVQRAVLAALSPNTFPAFLDAVQTEIAHILSVDVVRLCIESNSADSSLPHAVITPLEPGAVRAYLVGNQDIAMRKITLRPCRTDKSTIFTASANRIGSEALLRLDLGQKQLPALLALGSEDVDRFAYDQGVDLLSFFASAFERILRRWVA